MSHQEARYEYRSFAPALGSMEQRLRSAGGLPEIRDSAEVYLLSRADERYNFKIRDGRLELKVLEGRLGLLERWVPELALDFPVADAVLAETLVASLGLSAVLPPEAGRSPAALVAAVRAIPGAAAVDVLKHREGFQLDGCIAELVRVTVGGHTTRSICVEGVDPERVLELAARLELAGLPNISYLAEVRSLQGWDEDRPPGPASRESTAS
jgi:hypothetical protein